MNFNINKKLNYPLNINISIPRSIKQTCITWNVVSNPDKQLTEGLRITNVGYNVYRGDSINGIYYKLNKSIILTNRFDDSTVSINPNTRHWYKVSTVALYSDGSKTESRLSEPQMYQVKNENKWFNKINERNMWILKNTGVLMDLYVRKTTGERCPHCWDDVRGQSSNTDCKECFGTGYIGGYEPVAQLYVRQKPANQQIDLTSQGYSLNSNPGAWTISSTQIRNRDLLINPEGRIFSVTSSNISHAAGYYFHQELQMKELGPNDRRHNIERKSIYPEY